MAITNFNEAWEAYRDSHVGTDINQFLPIFVKEYPNLISTANKAIKQQMRRLNLLDESKDNPVKAKPVQNETKDKSETKTKVNKSVQKLKDPVKKAKKQSVKDLAKQPVDQDALDTFHETVNRHVNKIETIYAKSVLRDFPKALTQYAKREIDPDLSNAKAVAALIIALSDYHFTDKDVPSELLDAANKYQHKNSQENILLLLKQTKRELNEVLHINRQLMLLLGYFVSVSRWGFENDSGINKVSDLNNLNLDGQSVRKLLEVSRKVSDKLLTEERQRDGSNQRY